MPDRYTYPGSDVLINKLGITDREHWKFVETQTIGLRMGELREHPLPGSYDLAHLLQVHRHLTGDLYAWAGEVRDTDTHPGGTSLVHCRPPFIVPEAQRVFGQLAAWNHLQGLDADVFSDRLAWVWGETTTIHATRDVNTRSQHVFFNQLARDAGWVIDWSSIPSDVFAHARTLAIAQDHTGIDALIRPSLVTVERTARLDRLRDRMAKAELAFRTPRTTRHPQVLDRELDAARERRRRLGPPGPFPMGEHEAPGQNGPTLGL